jgi:hypothetical protein
VVWADARLARSIEGISGRVTLRWRFSPRFEYGRTMPECGWRGGVPVAMAGTEVVAVAHWDAGTPEWTGQTVGAIFELDAGGRALLALAYAHAEPKAPCAAVEKRLAEMVRSSGNRDWRRPTTTSGAAGLHGSC